MNDKELSAAVAQWARDHREEMVQDLISIVNRKSISEPGEGGFAFGTDCKDCADAMAEMGRKYGLDVYKRQGLYRRPAYRRNPKDSRHPCGCVSRPVCGAGEGNCG